jgi:hypothetical protein
VKENEIEKKGSKEYRQRMRERERRRESTRGRRKEDLITAMPQVPSRRAVAFLTASSNSSPSSRYCPICRRLSTSMDT